MKYYHHATQLLSPTMKVLNVASGIITADNHQNATEVNNFIITMMGDVARDMGVSEYKIHVQRLALVEVDNVEALDPPEYDGADIDDFNF